MNLEYCKDIAWSGCLESAAFNKLEINDQIRISENINSELDQNHSKTNPNGVALNEHNIEPKGKPCE